MQDKSQLSKNYFIDNQLYNCPFCNRQYVAYNLERTYCFNWDKQEKCFVYFVECRSCRKTSMHLSYEDITDPNCIENRFQTGIDIDSYIFYSAPSSNFFIDERIPRVIKEVISEADGCIRMNYLTGASSCLVKAIYELFVYEKAKGSNYKDKIEFLKQKYPGVNKEYFNTLSGMRDITCGELYGQPWYDWDYGTIKLLSETLKAILYEIYIIPQLIRERSIEIQELRENLSRDTKKFIESVFN